MNPFYSEWIHFIPNESKMSYQHGVSALLGVVMYAVGGGEIPGIVFRGGGTLHSVGGSKVDNCNLTIHM